MKIPIRTLLTIPFVSLTLIPVAVVGWLFYQNSQNTVNKSVGRLLEQTASRAENQIKLYLATPHFINELNANAINQRLLVINGLTEDSSEIQALETYFYEQVQSAESSQGQNEADEQTPQAADNEFNGSINHIYIGTEEGFFRGAEYRLEERDKADSNLIVAVSRGSANPNDREAPGTLSQYKINRDGTEERLQEEEFSLFERPWYEDGKEAWNRRKEAGWTEDPYCDQSTKRPAITAFRPVGRENTFLGVLGSDFLFDDIRDFLRGLLSDLRIEDGYILVVNNKNNWLLISTDDDLEPCTPGQDLGENDFKSDNSIVNSLQNKLLDGSSDSLLGLRRVELPEGNYYWETKEIVDPYGLNLSIIIAIPEKNFTGDINARTNTTIALAVGTFFLTGILGLLVSHWITQPVIELDAATQKLTRSINNPDAPGKTLSPLDIANPFELNALATTFNDMSARLIQTLAKFRCFVPNDFLKILGYQRADITNIERKAFKKIRKMTILFSDIRSYTKMNESMEPEESFEFINGYLDRMEPAITRNNRGFIDKYIGDAIMALFNEPNDGLDNAINNEPSSAENAVEAALEMLEILKEINATRNTPKRQPFKIGIGLHTGKDITLGILGGQSRWDTTVIGRDVNKASRVESLTKVFQSSLLVSQELVDELREKYPEDLQQVYPHRYLGTEPVRGIEEPVDIYEFYGEDPFELRECKEATSQLFQDGLELYKLENYILALEKFEAVLSECEKDGAAQCYAQRCRDHLGGM
jgi:class 3 adenylate cyclase